jgi:hypothetical protein
MWTWLTTTLQNRLRLDITDPEELLVMKGNREEEAGLWFTMAALHYNMQYYKDGEFENFKEMLRRVRWLKKKILEHMCPIITHFLSKP